MYRNTGTLKAFSLPCIMLCDHLSNTRLICTTSDFLFSQHCLQYPRNVDYQPIVMNAFGVVALNSWKNKEINLYSDHTKRKRQVLAFAAKPPHAVV